MDPNEEMLPGLKPKEQQEQSALTAEEPESEGVFETTAVKSPEPVSEAGHGYVPPDIARVETKDSNAYKELRSGTAKRKVTFGRGSNQNGEYVELDALNRSTTGKSTRQAETDEAKMMIEEDEVGIGVESSSESEEEPEDSVYFEEDGDSQVDVRGALLSRAKTRLIKEFGGDYNKFPAPNESQKLYVKELESADYEDSESRIQQVENHNKTEKVLGEEEAMRWVLVFLIGVFTALVAFFIDFFAKEIAILKFSATFAVLEQYNGAIFPAILVHIAFSTALVGVAAALVSFVEWSAAGSGIPEIKCYLNGMKIKKSVRAPTLIAKAVGVLFSVAGGLAVGKEGPMIHSGAIIAAGVSQAKSTTLKFDLNILKEFRNDHDKRDFISAGAAAGVAAAFGAPIGGVLFALEEGSSFWNQSLTWRSFFAAMVSTFTLNIFLSGVEHNNWGGLSQPGLISFGTFAGQQQPDYKIWELAFFLLLGVCGGLFGALFNELNTILTKWRIRKIRTKWTKFFEGLVVGSVTALCSMIVPFYLGQCKLEVETGEELAKSLRHMNCHPTAEYNDMASIFFTTWEDAIRQLFHNEGFFSEESLLVFFIVIFTLAWWTYGVSVPSGLFVPCLLTGLCGEILRQAMPGENIDPGTYALVGAASMLGGVARMTISLTVIVLECTNDVKYGLPIMITIMVAKWVGDVFNKGIYDIHIEIKHIPFLEFEPPAVMNTLYASDVMAHHVKVIKEKDTVENIIALLNSCRHNGFPVVKSDTDGSRLCHGLILRHQLVSLLLHRKYAHSEEQAERMERLAYQTVMAKYPRFTKIGEVYVPKEDMSCYVSLSAYMNYSVVTVNMFTPLTKIFRMFRSMGLRHMVVVDSDHKVVGMITRKNITHHASVHALESLSRQRAGTISVVTHH